MSPFVFADRYDPKKAYKHTCLALDTNTNFFRDPQSQVPHPSKSNFLGDLKLVYGTFAFEGVSKLKNHHQLTFGIVKSDWSVVWCPRLFSRIKMILRKLTNTHVVCQIPTENVFATLKVKCHIHQEAIILTNNVVKSDMRPPRKLLFDGCGT